MELNNLKPSERTIEITHPGTGAPIGVRVNVVSIDDERLKRVKRNISDESLRLGAKGKSFKTEELERNARQLLFTATTGWEWYNPTGAKGDKGFDENAAPTFNGETPAHTQRNFNDVVEALPWFADQIREAIDETKAFFDLSKPS